MYIALESDGSVVGSRCCATAFPKKQPKIARHFSAGILRLLQQVPRGRLNSSSLSPFLYLPYLSPPLNILISAHLQFSWLRAVKPRKALSSPIENFSRKKIFFYENTTCHLNRVTLRLRTADCGRRPCPPTIPNPKSS